MVGVDISAALRRAGRERPRPWLPARAGATLPCASTPGRCRSTPSSTPPSRCARARSAWWGSTIRRPGPRRSTPTAWCWPAWPGRCARAAGWRVSAFSSYFQVRFLEDDRHLRRRPGREPRAHRAALRGGRRGRATTCGRAASPPGSCACWPAPPAWWSTSSGRSRPGPTPAGLPTSTTPSSCCSPAGPTDRRRPDRQAPLRDGRAGAHFGADGTLCAPACVDRPARRAPPRAACPENPKKAITCPSRSVPNPSRWLRPPRPPSPSPPTSRTPRPPSRPPSRRSPARLRRRRPAWAPSPTTAATSPGRSPRTTSAACRWTTPTPPPWSRSRTARSSRAPWSRSTATRSCSTSATSPRA